MTEPCAFSLLEQIDTPEQLRSLPERELPTLADQLRQFLLQSVAASGGHLAAGLGAIELTIALHRTFKTPRDLIVWDVGHQCYPHKALTGRRRQLNTIRQRGGLSGFLRRDESPFDCFGAGHSSTSISAALAMAVAAARNGENHKTIAVIGDGAMTAGLAYEAMDHAGVLDADLLVIVNDNGMSISPNVGALSNHFARMVQTRSTDADGEAAWATQAQGARSPFEELGFQCFGPIDGHDIPLLLSALESLRDMRGPRLLHVVTEKGRGYEPAEADPVRYHGVTPFDPKRGLAAGAKAAAPTFTQIFGDWLCETAQEDERTVAITPAMREGSGLVEFAQKFPDRFFDVGIAEQHSVTFAAGLACRGLKPVVAIYSTFMQRAYDQLIHDVALQGLPVLFAIDRGGLVGPDGATHHGAFDLSYLRSIPDLIVMTPSDARELRSMLHTGFAQDGPAAVRYPRAVAHESMCSAPPELLPLGVARLCRSGRRVALLVFGSLLHTALKVADAIDASVFDMRFVKPLDARSVLDAADAHDLLVTIEENAVAGGAGSAVNECLAAHDCRVSTLNIGLRDRFYEHATRDEALRDAGLDAESLIAAIARRRSTQLNVEPVRRRSRGGSVTLLREIRRQLIPASPADGT